MISVDFEESLRSSEVLTGVLISLFPFLSTKLFSGGYEPADAESVDLITPLFQHSIIYQMGLPFAGKILISKIF